jgi:hypothetical protein
MLLLTATLTTVFAATGCEMPKPAKKLEVKEEKQPERTTNYQSGAGAVQNIRNAVNRVVTKHDLEQIRIFIESASIESNKMPSAEDTMAELRRSAPKIATLIDEKVITLHKAKNREDVWAYETAALTVGGLVLTSSGVERFDAAVLKQKLN